MNPVYEVQDGLEMLYCLGLRTRVGAELIACPTCGRIQVDLFTLVQQVRKKLAEEIKLPIKVAVMGCVVNGPGECEGADIAIFAGDRRGIIYVQGQKVANVAEEEILDAACSLQEYRKFEEKVKRRGGQARGEGGGGYSAAGSDWGGGERVGEDSEREGDVVAGGEVGAQCRIANAEFQALNAER